MPPQIQNINLNDEQLLIKLFTGLFFLVLGIIAMFRYDRLFIKWIKNEWWRKNLAVILVSELFFFAVAPIYPDVQRMINNFGLVFTLISYPIAFALMVFLIYNLFKKIYNIKYLQGKTFATKQLWMTVSIIIAGCLVILPINYVSNGFSLRYYALSCLWAVFFGGLVSIFNIVRNYIELERKQKLSEKELELSKLRELKTQAELDALHSKINPHFLYNALNSIADLSVTDGKKARKMTTALADLFRYSINYSNHNYASLKEEMEMAETYLQIEKIRFEDKLAYTVRIDDEVKHYLVPRFLLQPLAENAVKHGLKSTGTATSVELHAGVNENGLLIEVKDNGPVFPADINPGYGIKSVYDKLDLLFSGNYEIQFKNEPEKKIIIHITKMIKDEPVV
ncbi:MAG: histidine kinase [Sphingobacteriales bacterium]|nr:histidine kinase [Sphingobacteriales bacterium]MBI3717934.1 histidine kinase [Sphingobacteriales bacterium]